MKVIFSIPVLRRHIFHICFLVGWVLLMSIQGCVSVKAYQKVYLNDVDMKLSSRPIETYERNVESYREGASGLTNGKSGGGCGCN